MVSENGKEKHFTTSSLQSQIADLRNDLTKLKKSKIIILVQASLAVTLILLAFYLFLGGGHHGTFGESYLIENLRGDSVGTNVAWHLSEGDVFHVHILDNGLVTDDNLKAIKSAVLSTEYFDVDDKDLVQGNKSRFYAGWLGALSGIEKKTTFEIPLQFHVHKTASPDGQVIIILTNLSDPDGNSAYTKSIVDSDTKRILQSTIIIYGADRVSPDDLAVIVRHEFGHALGLAHSTDPDDLMYPQIHTEYPYISQCDIVALEGLYDGGESSKVVCEK